MNVNIPNRPGTGNINRFFDTGIAETDPAVSGAIGRELGRQR